MNRVMQAHDVVSQKYEVAFLFTKGAGSVGPTDGSISGGVDDVGFDCNKASKTQYSTYSLIAKQTRYVCCNERTTCTKNRHAFCVVLACTLEFTLARVHYLRHFLLSLSNIEPVTHSRHMHIFICPLIGHVTKVSTTHCSRCDQLDRGFSWVKRKPRAISVRCLQLCQLCHYQKNETFQDIS